MRFDGSVGIALNEPALAGGILVAPGVSPGYVTFLRFKSPGVATEISIALFEGLLFLMARIPGLTPGATFCRHLCGLIESFPFMKRNANKLFLLLRF